MKISSLYNIHKDKTIYIIGTGPSLRFFPKNFIDGKRVIGLNNAWQMFDCNVNLTIHPELIPKNWYKEKQIWITKQKKPEPTGPLDLIYWFESNKDVFDYKYLFSKDNTLYVGRGIQTTALCLAAKLGARSAILVGCDMNSLDGSHHAVEQSVQFHGLTPEEVYNEYYFNTTQVRQKLKDHYGMNTFSLSPFLGTGHHKKDYRRLLEEYDLPKYLSPVDVSTYNRDKPDFTS